MAPGRRRRGYQPSHRECSAVKVAPAWVVHFADVNARFLTLAHWLPALAWAGVIFALSAQPGSRVPGGWSVEGHLFVYAVLGSLVWWALGGRSTGVRGIVLAIAIASLYGMSDEFHQSFVPQRNPDVLDWLIDTVGATAAVVAAYYLAGRRERQAQRPSHGPSGTEQANETSSDG